MTPSAFMRNALEPALALLPATMDSPEARAMCLAICLQESRLTHRAQIGGPAKGYAQFERGGGVIGVLTHVATKKHIQNVLAELDYPSADSWVCHEAIEHNDILCAAFARLLLYTLPDLLPVQDDPEGGWIQYTKAWRPRNPYRQTWDAFYSQAWLEVTHGVLTAP